jgi:hypothetical protein
LEESIIGRFTTHCGIPYLSFYLLVKPLLGLFMRYMKKNLPYILRKMNQIEFIAAVADSVQLLLSRSLLLRYQS